MCARGVEDAWPLLHINDPAMRLDVVDKKISTVKRAKSDYSTVATVEHVTMQRAFVVVVDLNCVEGMCDVVSSPCDEPFGQVFMVTCGLADARNTCLSINVHAKGQPAVGRLVGPLDVFAARRREPYL